MGVGVILLKYLFVSLKVLLGLAKIELDVLVVQNLVQLLLRSGLLTFIEERVLLLGLVRIDGQARVLNLHFDGLIIDYRRDEA